METIAKTGNILITHIFEHRMDEVCAELQVAACVHASGRGIDAVVEIMVLCYNILDRLSVANDITFKTPFLSKNISQ